MKDKLYGLIVCGGKSSRMGSDKSVLNYHGQPQRYYLYNILKELCDEVFISCNSEQHPGIPPSFNPLPDDPKFGDIGPMTGLLTAFEKVPDASFLVVGCDYPFLEKKDLEALVEAFKATNSSVVYHHHESNYTEPLLAVYHNDMIMCLHNKFQLKEYSLRRFLEGEQVNRITAPQPKRLRSVDTWEDYENIVTDLNIKQ